MRVTAVIPGSRTAVVRTKALDEGVGARCGRL
jgi:hypothetical protein